MFMAHMWQRHDLSYVVLSRYRVIVKFLRHSITGIVPRVILRTRSHACIYSLRVYRYVQGVEPHYPTMEKFLTLRRPKNTHRIQYWCHLHIKESYIPHNRLQLLVFFYSLYQTCSPKNIFISFSLLSPQKDILIP